MTVHLHQLHLFEYIELYPVDAKLLVIKGRRWEGQRLLSDYFLHFKVELQSGVECRRRTDITYVVWNVSKLSILCTKVL